ncbi:methyl-accepting chemotaxis protein [Chitiniphilus eburneus]|nr:methyl-accepting chemotaxis protein [Chitiniphilus eburneus]
MRNNQPVTHHEIHVPKDIYLVSQTDLKGIITDANDAFVKISGFERSELIGKSHNLVRHPDMPEVVFDELWATLKSGLPWRGIVKNRAKSGDCYWVDAQICPIQRNGVTTGYMSVRRSASRDAISDASRLYAQLAGSRKTTAAVRKHGVQVQSAFFGLQILAFLAFLAAMPLGSSAWRWLCLVICLAGLLASMALLRYRIFGPLTRLHHQVGQLAEGNLSERIAIVKPDEAGFLQNQLTVLQMRWLVSIDHNQSAIKSALTNIEQAAQRSASINGQIHEQYGQISSTAASTEQFSQTIAEVAGNAAATSAAASASLTQVSEGRIAMKYGEDAMQTIIQTVGESTVQLSKLHQAVAQIGDIAITIKEISDQTNLLALNAAIEAARAGEQGRGFAVVADEVRKLAERTGSSTQEIGVKINAIQKMALQVVDTVEAAGAAVQEGAGRIVESGRQFESVSQSSSHTVELSEHIATAAQQQNQASQDIARNMENMAGLSLRNRDDVAGLAVELDALRGGLALIRDGLNQFQVIESRALAG